MASWNEEQVFQDLFETYIDSDAYLDGYESDSSLAHGHITTLPAAPIFTPPIHKLPPEILCKIFRILQDDIPDDYLNQIGRDNTLSLQWFVVNFVCRQWRQIALLYPSLWSSIDVGKSLQWVALCLDRSQHVSIDVYFCLSNIMADAVRTLVVHASRIRAVSLAHDAAHTLPSLASLFNAGMEALEDLRLDACSIGIEKTTPLQVLFKLNEQSIPVLRRLHLRVLSLSWTSPIIAHLRVIELYHSEPDDNRPYSLDDFLSALEACQSLEKLKLVYSYPFQLQTEVAENGGTNRIVTLPRIRTIELHSLPSDGSLIEEFQVLAHLHLPVDATVFVSAIVTSPSKFQKHIPSDVSCLPILRSAVEVHYLGEWRFHVAGPCRCGQDCDRKLGVAQHRAAGEGGEACPVGIGGCRCFTCGSQVCPNSGLLRLELVYEGWEDLHHSPKREDAALRNLAALMHHAPVKTLYLTSGPTAAAYNDAFHSFPAVSSLVFECDSRATEWDVQSFLSALCGSPITVRARAGVCYPEGEGEGTLLPIARTNRRHKSNSAPGKRSFANFTKTPGVPLRNLQTLRLRHLTWYDGLARDIEAFLALRADKGMPKMKLHICVASVVLVDARGDETLLQEGLTDDRQEELSQRLERFLAEPIQSSGECQRFLVVEKKSE